MKVKHNKYFIRLIAFAILVAMLVPSQAFAATVDIVQPYASNYLTSYNAYVCAMGNGRVEVWYTVIGDTYMDEIGTLRIMIYESTNNSTWTWKKTYLHEDYSTMLAYDDIVQSNCVSYQGVAGRYYKAYVCIWAGKDGSGDTRYMWTSVERAT